MFHDCMFNCYKNLVWMSDGLLFCDNFHDNFRGTLAVDMSYCYD